MKKFKNKARLIDKIGYFMPPKESLENQGLELVRLLHPELQETITMSIHVPPPSIELQNITFIYSHGNAENIPLSQMWMDDCCRMFRCRFVCYDYMGYGETKGKASEPSTLKIIEFVFNQVQNMFKDNKIIIWGRSIGTVASTYIASIKSHEVQFLILESGMANGIKVICSNKGFVNCLRPCNAFFNEERILDVQCPILIIHGTDDGTVPFRNSIDLVMAYKLKNCPTERIKVTFEEEKQHQLIECGKLWHLSVNDGGHNDIDVAYEKLVVDIIVLFYRHHFGTNEMVDVRPENKRNRMLKKNKDTNLRKIM